jgi:hypothetical protein
MKIFLGLFALGLVSSSVLANSDNIDEPLREQQIYTEKEITIDEKRDLNTSMLDRSIEEVYAALDDTGWVQMNSKGTKWYHAAQVHGITAFYSSGSRDRSVESYYTPSAQNPFRWVNGRIYYLNLQGGGNRSHSCPDRYIVDGVYYEDSGDDSVEILSCWKINKRTRNHKNISLKKEGDTWCPSNYFLTGVTYKDSGDDYITHMRCSSLY